MVNPIALYTRKNEVNVCNQFYLKTPTVDWKSNAIVSLFLLSRRELKALLPAK